MGLNASKAPKATGPAAEPLEAANYIGRVVQVLDLGLQKQRPYQGKEKPPAHEIMVGYELGTEFMKDDNGEDIPEKPRWLTETFPLRNLEADLAKSTKRANVFDPSGKLNGDFSQMVNAPVTITVVNNKKGESVYNNIGNVTPPMKGFPVPELVNPPKVFDLEEPDLEVFHSLPQWVQDKIKGNLNYNGSILQRMLDGNTEAAQTEKQDVEEPAVDNDDDDVWE